MDARAPARASFRSDINGLRAWAVLAVVLYHFGVPGFSGGFVGVDVFFVISGLLMTGMVVSGLERGDFSIAGFYMARARRIAPALLVLCAVLLALGWWLLLPVDYTTLGAQSASALTFMSNISFWLESGYFDVSSHEKWLLHTWSLAVEWQFYLVLPVVLSLLWRVRPGRSTMVWAVALGITASFALSVALAPNKPTGSFFMLPTRAWEMLAGGAVCLFASRFPLLDFHRRVMEFAGLAMIAICIGAMDASVPWPGWRAGLPVLGSMLVLVAARDRSWFTGNALAQWLGTRSYSIYLWHWPISVSLRYVGVFDQPAWIAAALALTFLLGDFSYRLVETNSRNWLNKLSFRREVSALAGGSAAVFLAAMVVFLNQGFAGRLQPTMEMVSGEQFNTNPRRAACHAYQGSSSPSCIYGGEKLGVILVGDSHADALVTALSEAVGPTLGVMQWSFSACPTLPGAHRANRDLKNTCGAFVDWAVKQLETIPGDIPLVIVNRHAQYARGKNEDPAQDQSPWVSFSRPYAKTEAAFLNEYAQHLTDFSCKLARTRKVYLVRSIPEMGTDVPDSARAMVFGIRKDVSVSLMDYHARNAFSWAGQDAAQAQCGIQILDPLPYLCWDGRCHGSKDGRPMYSDDNHLSEFGNKLLVPMFKAGLEKSLTGV